MKKIIFAVLVFLLFLFFSLSFHEKQVSAQSKEFLRVPKVSTGNTYAFYLFPNQEPSQLTIMEKNEKYLPWITVRDKRGKPFQLNLNLVWAIK